MNEKRERVELYGWRAKYGFIVPAENGVCEMEFHRIFSQIEGICIYTTRMAGTGRLTTSKLTEMINKVDDPAEELAEAKVDLIVFACTTGSLIKGPGYDQEIINRIQNKTGIPATTTSTSVIKALKKMGINKVAVATSYTDEVTAKVRSYIEGNGLHVVGMNALGIADALERSELPPTVSYRLAREVDKPEAEGIFISCTNFRTIEIIENLEHDLRKPVVTSNQASVWDALRSKGIQESIEGYGKLLRS
jgi:maleate isomerase